jgi:imidazolonepropionase-like amidohydrolase
VAAEACGLSDTLGTLAEGKAADVIVVQGDPLDDIKQMQDLVRITWVVKGGAVVRQPGE